MDPGGRFLVLLLIALALSCPVITVLKGKIGLALLGLLFHPCWLVGACTLAKPDSWWAARFYDEAQLERARRRHGDGGPPDDRDVVVWPRER